VVIVAIIATYIASMQTSIYDLVAESSILGLVAILVPMSSALFLKSASKLGAVLSMVFGLFSYLYFEYVNPIHIPAMMIGFTFSVFGMAIGFLRKKWQVNQ
jgi:Na+/proline symporter